MASSSNPKYVVYFSRLTVSLQQSGAPKGRGYFVPSKSIVRFAKTKMHSHMLRLTCSDRRGLAVVSVSCQCKESLLLTSAFTAQLSIAGVHRAELKPGNEDYVM